MTPTSTTGILDEAAVHLARAAQLLDAQDTTADATGATTGLFFPQTRALAAQLLLIAYGIRPRTVSPSGLASAGGPVIDDVDLALVLIESIDPEQAPADLLIWSLRLKQLRPRILTATAPAS